MYLWLKILVEPKPFWRSDCQTEILMFIRQFAVSPAKQCETIFACFEADSFSPSYLKSYFFSYPVMILFYSSLIHHPSVDRSVLPLHSVSPISTFCCIWFEVIVQELSNQSLIILLHGSRTICMGSNLIYTTFLVSIPLIASAIPPVWLTPWLLAGLVLIYVCLGWEPGYLTFPSLGKDRFWGGLLLFWVWSSCCFLYFFLLSSQWKWWSPYKWKIK